MAATPDFLRHPAIWRGDALSVPDSIPTGFAELDRELPGGGWPQSALTEILLAQQGIGEIRFLLPALKRLSAEDKWIVFIAPPHIPYAPALLQAGIPLARFLWVNTADNRDSLWAFEQTLRSSACGAALAWLPSIEEKKIRRLQLAAIHGRTWGVWFRRVGAGSPWAALRLRLSARPNTLRVEILKRRGSLSAAPLDLTLPYALDLSLLS